MLWRFLISGVLQLVGPLMLGAIALYQEIAPFLLGRLSVTLLVLMPPLLTHIALYPRTKHQRGFGRWSVVTSNALWVLSIACMVASARIAYESGDVEDPWLLACIIGYGGIVLIVASEARTIGSMSASPAVIGTTRRAMRMAVAWILLFPLCSVAQSVLVSVSWVGILSGYNALMFGFISVCMLGAFVLAWNMDRIPDLWRKRRRAALVLAVFAAPVLIGFELVKLWLGSTQIEIDVARTLGVWILLAPVPITAIAWSAIAHRDAIRRVRIRHNDQDGAGGA
ncbi:MAG: hypothetical protein AAGH64_09690 [Planctomycetota bacterium]